MIEVFFDGSCEPVNPGGTAWAGVVIYKSGVHWRSISRKVGTGDEMSNNVAEHAALLFALESLAADGLEKENIKIFGDSMLVVKQMSNEWKLGKGLYLPYAIQTKKIAANFNNITFDWIPREQNAEADALTRGDTPPDPLTSEYWKMFACA